MNNTNNTTDTMNQKRDLSFYLQLLDQIRAENLNQTTNEALANHPYLVAAKEGQLTLAQRRAFVGEQYAIQYSDACSFARLAGHENFRPSSLAVASVPEASNESNETDLFQFLLGGELYASKLLLAYAKSVGLEEEDLKQFPVSAKGQAYPSYWARLALANNRGAGAAACAVNFPAWGKMCAELSQALKSRPEYGYEGMVENEVSEALAFVDFFGSPIENLDEMAARVMMEENVSYEDIVTEVRLLQEYEILFWDSVYSV